MLVFLYGAQQILFLFIEPDFSEQVESIYQDFTSNEHQCVLDTEQTTIAAMLSYQKDDGIEKYPDPETIARISFYSAHRTSHDDIKF